MYGEGDRKLSEEQIKLNILYDGFSKDDSPDEVRNVLEELDPSCKSYVDNYGPNYLLFDVKFGGCYHIKFNDDGVLQTIRLHKMDLKKYKLHRLTLWKRHWWTD